MSTYHLSGSGTQTLSSGVGQLHVTITTFPSAALYGTGAANPVNYYKIGQLRPGDGTGYWRPIPIDATNCWLGLPTGTTRIGYSLDNGAEIDVVEVFADNPFRGPSGPTGPTGPAGAGGVVSNASATLGSSISLSTTAFTDVLSVSLTSGTWVLWAHITVFGGGTTPTTSARISDGTTTYGSVEFSTVTNGDAAAAIVSEPVVLTATTTLKLQAKAASSGQNARATGNYLSEAKATRLLALKIA